MNYLFKYSLELYAHNIIHMYLCQLPKPETLCGSIKQSFHVLEEVRKEKRNFFNTVYEECHLLSVNKGCCSHQANNCRHLQVYTLRELKMGKNRILALNS